MTARVLGQETVTASTVGTWLHQFAFGHVRQLGRVSEIALTRAEQSGADRETRDDHRHRLNQL